MNKLCLLLVVSLFYCSTELFAQEDAVDKDTSEMVVIHKGSQNHYHSHNDNGFRLGMLDLGFSTYLEDGSLNLSEENRNFEQRLLNSLNIGVHVLNLRTSFGDNEKSSKFAITTGLKINMNKYAFTNDFRLLPNSEDIYAAIEPVEQDLKKNRLFATYLAIPLLLDFQFHPKKRSNSFDFSVGYVANILLGANHKIKGDELDKEKTRDNFHLNKYLGMVEARVGIGPLHLYFQYGLNQLFVDNLGPELTPINFGVNIIPR